MKLLIHFLLDETYQKTLQLANVDNITFTYTYTITGGDYKDYVVLVPTASDSQTLSAGVITGSFTVNVNSPLVHTLGAFELNYAEDQKPLTKGEYDEMVAKNTTAEDLVVTLTISAEAVASRQ